MMQEQKMANSVSGFYHDSATQIRIVLFWWKIKNQAPWYNAEKYLVWQICFKQSRVNMYQSTIKTILIVLGYSAGGRAAV